MIPARLLVVEDDEFFREALSASLKADRYDVTEAPNGKVAQDILKSLDFDLILADFQLPYLSGLDLIAWARQSTAVPFILMTGYPQQLSKEAALQMGGVEIMTKPFGMDKLRSLLAHRLEETRKLKKSEAVAEHVPKSQGPEGEKQVDAADYCKVSLAEFVSEKKLFADVFIRVGEHKMVRIGREGGWIPRERIESYKAKGVKYLYVRREDFHKVVHFNLHLAKLIQKSDRVTQEKKMNFLRYTGEVILEHLYVDGVDKEGFDDASEFLQTMINALTDDQNILDILDYLNKHSDYLYAHSLCVSLYSLMIARRMGYESTQLFFKLGTGGLLHDIGNKEIDREILDKPRPLLNFDERRLIESHPIRGRDILMALKTIPSDVVQIALQHHEDCTGHGYPSRLKKHQIHPLARIVSVADRFAHLVLQREGFDVMTAREAIRHLEINEKDSMDAQPFSALKSVHSA